MESLKSFLNYFVTTNTLPDTLFIKIGLIVSGAALLLGLVLPLVPQLRGELVRSLANWFRAMGLLFLVLLFLRYESLWPFTIRLWVSVAVIPALVWLALIIRAHRRKLPEIASRSQFNDQYEQYLPKAKQRSRA